MSSAPSSQHSLMSIAAKGLCTLDRHELRWLPRLPLWTLHFTFLISTFMLPCRSDFVLSRHVRNDCQHELCRLPKHRRRSLHGPCASCGPCFTHVMSSFTCSECYSKISLLCWLARTLLASSAMFALSLWSVRHSSCSWHSFFFSACCARRYKFYDLECCLMHLGHVS